MKMTGVEVSIDTLKNVQPNTVLVVFTDQSGVIKVVKVDNDSIPKGQSFVQVNGQGGCWVCMNSYFEWFDPCP